MAFDIFNSDAVHYVELNEWVSMGEAMIEVVVRVHIMVDLKIFE